MLIFIKALGRGGGGGVLLMKMRPSQCPGCWNSISFTVSRVMTAWKRTLTNNYRNLKTCRVRHINMALGRSVVSYFLRWRWHLSVLQFCVCNVYSLSFPTLNFQGKIVCLLRSNRNSVKSFSRLNARFLKTLQKVICVLPSMSSWCENPWKLSFKISFWVFYMCFVTATTWAYMSLGHCFIQLLYVFKFQQKTVFCEGLPVL